MPKSIIIKKNGGPEVLELQDVNVGSPGPDEIKVTNHVIGLNYIDTYHRSGLYPLQLPSGIGLEAAGKIDEVGSNVSELLKRKKIFKNKDELINGLMNYLNLKKNINDNASIPVADFIEEKIVLDLNDYFYSNVIARSSKTMSECRNIKIESKKTGTES